MATRLSRKLAGSSTVLDGKNSRRVDVYTSDYTSEVAAMIDANLPKIGTEHPSIPGLFVDSYSFSPVEDGHLDISVNCSNDGFFTILENPKTSAETAPRLQFGVKQVTVKIPAFAMSSKVVGSSGAVRQIVNVWEVVELSYEEYRAMVSYRVIVPTLNLADVNAMSEEIHKIHTLGGVQFEMQPWSQTPHDKNHDEVTYFWIRDQGTKDPRTLPGWNQTQAARVSIPPLIPNTGTPGLIRKPYTNIVAIPSAIPFDADELPLPPDYFTIPFAINNPNGWMSLPGLT